MVLPVINEKICESFKNGEVFNVAMIQQINAATAHDLTKQEDNVHFTKSLWSHFLTHAHCPHTHRHQAHWGAPAGSCVRWDQVCQMPDSHCTSWVSLQWQATKSWAGLLPTSGVNGYHRVILLPGNPFYLEQVAGQCLFPHPHFGYLSSHCLSACQERRTTCTEVVLWVYRDPSVIWAVLVPKDLSAQRLYQHPSLFLTSHPCEAYQGTGSQTCHTHIFQHSPSFSAVSYILAYQYRPFFYPLVCCFFSHTHILPFTFPPGQL